MLGLIPFLGGGIFLNFDWFGWWRFYFDFLGGFFGGGSGLKFTDICSTFTHSFTQFLSCTVVKCKCWMVCFLCFGAIKHVA